MKRKVLLPVVTLFFAFTCCCSAYAQAPTWAWARKGATVPGSVSVAATGTDAAGNVYVTGRSSAGIGFAIPGEPLLPAGMFLAKYTPQGMPVWARQARCTPRALFADAAGNSYVTGKFNDTLTLGSYTFVCQGRWDMFVAKFDPDGNVLWASRAGGNAHPANFPGHVLEEDEGCTIGADLTGNCYVGARVMTAPGKPATFDNIVVHSTPPATDLFDWHNVIVKYSAAGQAQWVSRVAGVRYFTRGMAITGQGEVYLIGMFRDSVDFNGTTLVSNGQEDICYSRYSSSGNQEWVRGFGGSGIDFGEAVAVNQQGEVFLTGSFEDSFQSGSFALNGSNDLFLIKCDSNGNAVWASQTTGSGNVGESRLAADAAGNCYVSCMFSDSVTVGLQEFISVNGSYDPMVIKWNAAGTAEWAMPAYGTGSDWANGIALDPAGIACYLTGSFESNLIFQSHTLYAQAASNLYLARLQLAVSAAPDEAPELNWLIFPNPASRALYLNLPELYTQVQVQLADLQGRQVFSSTFSDMQEAVLELPVLPQGVYLLTLQTGGQVLRKKVVVSQ